MLQPNLITVNPKRDLRGQKFHKLTVVRAVKRLNDKTYWECICDCGGIRVTRGDCLKRTFEPTKSCGCLINGHLTHGASKTPAMRIWAHMKDRCFNPRDKAYSRYGGRGITVCERWMVFSNFLADMGQPPSPNLSIERKNNNEGYSPDNCKWATSKEQNNNRRDTIWLTMGDATKTATAWGAALGLKSATITARRRKGYTDEECLKPLGSFPNQPFR